MLQKLRALLLVSCFNNADLFPLYRFILPTYIVKHASRSAEFLVAKPEALTETDELSLTKQMLLKVHCKNISCLILWVCVSPLPPL